MDVIEQLKSERIFVDKATQYLEDKLDATIVVNDWELSLANDEITLQYYYEYNATSDHGYNNSKTGIASSVVKISEI